jgi:hypothetical protein
LKRGLLRKYFITSGVKERGERKREIEKEGKE